MDGISPTMTLRRDGFKRLTIAFWVYVVGFAAMLAFAKILPDALYIAVVAVWFVAWLAFLATLWLLASSFKKSAIICVGLALVLGPIGVVAMYIWIRRLGKRQSFG